MDSVDRLFSPRSYLARGGEGMQEQRIPVTSYMIAIGGTSWWLFNFDHQLNNQSNRRAEGRQAADEEVRL